MKRVAIAALALALTSHAAIAEQARIWIKYGVGGYFTSYGMGPGSGSLADAIAAKFGSAVKVTSYYQWTDAIAATVNATPVSIKVMIAGYSCGASELPLDAVAVHRPVDLLAGIQASVWCGSYLLPANVAGALEVYNPTCPMTLGLGCRLYQPGPGFAGGRLTVVVRYDMHPYADIDPDAHADVIEAIGKAMTAKPKAALHESGAPQIIVRQSTWR